MAKIVITLEDAKDNKSFTIQIKAAAGLVGTDDSEELTQAQSALVIMLKAIGKGNRIRRLPDDSDLPPPK